jgi:osmotically-inducible protein OsmY
MPARVESTVTSNDLKESKMKQIYKIGKRQLLPTLVASALIGGTVAAPVAYAADQHMKDDKSMEQYGDEAQSAIKDAWLDGKLETALLFNEHLNSFSIDTEVKSGVAYLTGAVESDIDRDLAGEIAKSIDGVSKVENKLTVDKAKITADMDNDMAHDRSTFKRSVANATLTARIKSELLLNTNTAGLSIDVDSRDGEVTLSGEVDSQQEKELAEQIADNTNGEGSVTNNLRVASGS